MAGDVLKLTSLKGTAMQCGEAYGRIFEPLIMGFCQQGVRPDKKKLSYARKCWRHVEQCAPVSARFMRGVSAGSHLPLEHITLLTLHEEVAHMAHCTAFVACGAATRGGRTVNAMNWDWSPSLYVWPGLLRLQVKGTPAALTCHYPGLWAAAGINDAGLSLMWTSSGGGPKSRPRVGLPTYVLIAEVLRRRTVEEAVDYIRRTKRAGPFNLLLGDASGGTAVVEGMPGYLSIERSGDAMVRANHYVCEDMVRRAGQKLSRRPTPSTVARYRQMVQLVRRQYSKITAAVARKMLTNRRGSWPWIHQFPGGPAAQALGAMTIDSLIAVSQDRVLHTCRGGRTPGPWQAFSL